MDLSGETPGLSEDIGAYGERVIASWTKVPTDEAQHPDVFVWVSESSGDSWSEGRNLSNDSAMHDGFSSVAATSTSAIVGWWSYAGFDGDDSNDSIEVSRYADGTWSAPQSISGSVTPHKLGYPQIEASGSTYYAIWGSHAWLFVKSTDDGLTWSEPVAEIRSEYFPSIEPMLAVSGRHLTVIWRGDRPPKQMQDLYSKSSQDGGAHWGPKRRITNSTEGEYNQDVAVRGSTVVAAWEKRTKRGSVLTVARSTDAGKHWLHPRALARLREEGANIQSSPLIDVVATPQGFEIVVAAMNGARRRYVSRAGRTWRREPFPLPDSEYTGMAAVATKGERHVVATRVDDDYTTDLIYLRGLEDGR